MTLDAEQEIRTTTRADVARLAGVSPAVVSYVLNDGPRPVAAATRARVLRAVDQLRYRPNAVARALKFRRTNSLGLLVPDNSNPYFAELARAVEDVAYEHGHALVLANSNNDPDRARVQLHALLDRQVDGLLLISTGSGGELGAASRSTTPSVFLDRAPQRSDLPSVVVDNTRGAEEATRHLIEEHGLVVDCFAGPDEVHSAVDRVQGWRLAMQRAGHSTEERLHRTPFTRIGGYTKMVELIEADRAPRALFASSDLHAVGILRAAHEAGLRVPEDLAVVAFDGTQESEYTSPPLTVIRQPVREIAETAVRLVLARGAEPAPHATLPGTLVIRNSCGCVGAKAL